MYGNNYWSYENGPTALYDDAHFSYPYDISTTGPRQMQSGQTAYEQYGRIGLFSPYTLPPPPPLHPTDDVSVSFTSGESGRPRIVMEKHSSAQRNFAKARRRDDITRTASVVEKYVRHQTPSQNGHQHRRRRSHQDWHQRYLPTSVAKQGIEDKIYDMETLDWDTNEYPRAMTPSFVGSGEPIVAGEKQKEINTIVESQLSIAQKESISMWELNMKKNQLFTGAISSSNISKGRPAKEMDFKRTFPCKADFNVQWEHERKIQASLNSKPDVENSIPDIDGPMITVYRTSTKLVRKPRPMNHSKDIETNSSPEPVGTALASEAVVLPSAISLNNTASSKLSAVSQLVPRSGMLCLSTKALPAPLSSIIHTTDTTKDLSTNSKKDIPSKVVFSSTINKGEDGKCNASWKQEQGMIKDQLTKEGRTMLNHLCRQSGSWEINKKRLRINNDRDIEWDSDEDITKLVPKKILVLPEEQKTMNTSSSSSSIDISSDAEILPDGGCCNNQDNEQAHLEQQKTNISSFSADRYIISPRDSPNIQMCNSPHLAVPSLSCSVANSPCSTIISPRKDQYNLREEIVPITPPMPTSPVTGTSTLHTSFSIDSLSDKRITLKSAVPPSDGNNYRVPRTIKKSLKNIPMNSRPYRGLMSLRIINGKRVAGDSRECFANLEGKCAAGIFCRFEHDGSTNHQNKKVCSRLLRGLCRPDANCSHHVLLPHQYPVCQFFLRVSCFEPNCQLLHVKHSCNLQPCEDFNKGICLAGDDCDYPHRYIYQTVKKRGIYVHEEEPHRSTVAEVDMDDATTLQWIT